MKSKKFWIALKQSLAIILVVRFYAIFRLTDFSSDSFDFSSSQTR